MSKEKGLQKIKRAAVPLGNAGAVMSIINQALAIDAVKLSLASYIEGRGLPGNWRLEIQAARLVPVDAGTPSADGA